MSVQLRKIVLAHDIFSLRPRLRNVLLRPGMSAEQLEDDARERHPAVLSTDGS